MTTEEQDMYRKEFDLCMEQYKKNRKIYKKQDDKLIWRIRKWKQNRGWTTIECKEGVLTKKERKNFKTKYPGYRLNFRTRHPNFSIYFSIFALVISITIFLLPFIDIIIRIILRSMH